MMITRALDVRHKLRVASSILSLSFFGSYLSGCIFAAFWKTVNLRDGVDEYCVRYARERELHLEVQITLDLVKIHKYSITQKSN